MNGELNRLSRRDRPSRSGEALFALLLPLIWAALRLFGGDASDQPPPPRAPAAAHPPSAAR